MRLKRVLPILIGVATIAGFALMVRQTGASAVHAAASPDWTWLGIALLLTAAVQPMRAWAWTATLREPISFRAVFAASSIGSFLDTVLPGRLGEASKVAVLRVASGSRWPGISKAGGSLVCTHLLEGLAFALVGAVAAFFMPVPASARIGLVIGIALAVGGVSTLLLLQKRLGHRIPRFARGFLAGAAAPLSVILKTGLVLIVTWAIRWVSLFFVLKAFGVEVGLGGALLYMVVTGLANTAPLLPGNAGIYQGAAMGALAMIGHAGASAVAVSLLAPVVGMVATAAAAVIAMAFYGRRFIELPRAAFSRA
jgi:phosphatidylinositol alpha-mannosyltransferase